MKNFLSLPLLMLLILATTITTPRLYAQTLELKSLEVTPPFETNSIERHSYNFGRVRLYSTQRVRYQVTNTGSTPLTFKQATIVGAGFDATHSCLGELLPQNKCQFFIRFSPNLIGLNSGRFTLSFVENSDIIVNLWGEGY